MLVCGLPNVVGADEIWTQHILKGNLIHHSPKVDHHIGPFQHWADRGHIGNIRLNIAFVFRQIANAAHNIGREQFLAHRRKGCAQPGPQIARGPR